MGGKNKGNRTKNNARPSSSARSAELLGTQAQTFFGLGTVKDGSTPILPIISSAPGEIDAMVDTNFQLALKKMGKKDPITKLKALQEFSELCSKADVTEVKSILPFWPRLYGQLCSDTEHRVREAAHQSHKAVIAKVKKHLAPYLKEIIGPWYSSQYDTYPPAASAAVAAFNEAFSAQKMAEAVTFCQEEILSYFYQNIVVHTQQTLSNPKTNSAEEMEDRYRRVVSSSFLAYASYLQNVKPDSLLASADANKKIISSPKFWKMANHNDPIIRHAFLSAFIALCQHAKWLLEPEQPRVAAAIFNHLSEEDPLVLPLLWEAVLNGVVAVPKCWESSNVEKQLIPKLFQILRSGGKGHAFNIFPKILPLLNVIPPEKIGEKDVFLSQLFASMRNGMLEMSVNRSQSESRIVSSTFIESLQYMIMVNRDDTSLVEKLVGDQLIAAFDDLWTNSLPNLLTAVPFYCLVAQTLRTWYRNVPLYEAVTKHFWICLENLFDSKLSIQLSQEELKKMLACQTELLAVLKNPRKYASKNREKVRFNMTNETPKEAFPEVEVVPAFDEALLTFAQSAAIRYVQEFMSCRECVYLSSLLHLAKCFDVRRIYDAASAKCNLLELFSTSIESDVSQEILVPLGLQLLPHLPADVQETIVLRLSEKDSTDLVLLCSELLGCSSPTIKAWIKSDTFTIMYLNLMSDFLSGQVEVSASDPLCGFLSPVVAINEKCFETIIEIICEILSDESTVLDHVNMVLSVCGRDICRSPQFRTLVVRIFCLSCTSDGELYSSLLSTTLMKLKVFAITDSVSWLDLAKSMNSDLFAMTYNADEVSRTVTKIVEVALDVDLTVACDPEEIKEAASLLRIFLEPPAWIWSCALTLKEMALAAAELCAKCNLLYYQLKDERLAVGGASVDEELLACINDAEMMRCYRAAHLSKRTCNKFETVCNGQVNAYLQWLKMSNTLLQLLLSAYPRSSKFEDMAVPGRILVDQIISGQKIIPVTDVECDVLSWDITMEDWQQLEKDESVAGVFSKEDFPDENMFVTLSNCMLDVLEGAAFVDVIIHLIPEIECYPVLNKSHGELLEDLKWTVRSTTPKEFEFLYEFCRTLVTHDAGWCAIKPHLKPILGRLFKGCYKTPNVSSVETTLAELLGPISTPRQVLQLTAIVQSYAHIISLDRWNDIFVQLENILKRVQSSSITLKSEDLTQAAAVSSFFLVVQDCFMNCLKRKDDERLAPELIQMWNDLVEKELWCNLHGIWRSILPQLVPRAAQQVFNADGPTDKVQWITNPVAVRRLCAAIVSPTTHPVPVINSGDNALNYAHELSQLLLSPHSSLQITAFCQLCRLVPELVAADALALQTHMADELNEDKAVFTRTRDCDWTMKRLENALVASQTVVEALLSDFKPGDTCTVQPFTDAFTYSHGYLLLWCLILEMCGEAHVALRFQYGAWLKSCGYLSIVLKSVFNLMPVYVVHGDARDTSRLFAAYDNLDINASATSGWIEQRACFLYRQCLKWLPASVRDWYSETEHQVAGLITRATSIHVSPILIAAELKAVQNASSDEMENISIAVSLVSREVIGTYVIDEASVQIVISLPNNYPLGTIKVDFKSQTAIPRAWRISMFLVHRNGSIRDALALWKSDLDKKFEGIEECEICFSILQGPNFDIPKQSCKTCKKKFHSACLYKWFNTSNKSSCPHCRNQF